MSAVACSACYGSGYGVDEKACPCGCRPAPAISPPVAAGSVDTPEFQRLAELWRYAPAGTREFMAAWDGQIAHIDAWGAQQRVSGRQDEAARIRHLTYERDQFRTAQGVALNAVADLRQRAEKAEAELIKSAKAQAELQEKFDKQGTEFCVASLKLRDAESRLRPMEAYFRMMCLETPKPFGTPIDPSDMPC